MKFGGLGIWGAVDLAPSTYLASSKSSASDLIYQILPAHFRTISVPVQEDVRLLGQKGSGLSAPEEAAQKVQKSWDTLVEAIAESLLRSATDSRDSAHLASSAKESGAWLNTRPI